MEGIMEGIYEWMKNLIFSLCLLELCCHLVRSRDYRKYVRFFGGILLMSMMVGPVLRFFSNDAIFEESLRRAFLQEEVADMELAKETLSGLQNRQISKAYRRELERQMGEIVQAHHGRALKVEIDLEGEDGYPAAVTGVEILLAAKNEGLNVFEKDAGSDRGQQEAEAIRAEIASVYGLSRDQVLVTRKE